MKKFDPCKFDLVYYPGIAVMWLIDAGTGGCRCCMGWRVIIGAALAALLVWGI